MDRISKFSDEGLVSFIWGFSFNGTTEPLLFITKISGTYRRYSFAEIKAKARCVLKSIKEKTAEFDLLKGIRGIPTRLRKLFGIYRDDLNVYYKGLSKNVYEKTKDGSIYARTDGKRIVAGRIISIGKDEESKKMETYLFDIVGQGVLLRKKD
jgi:hypothetical protein